MTNHVHLLITPERAESLPRAMQSLGRRYVRAINAARRRSGTLWERRYRAAPIDSEAYFLGCCRYIELNPVRARMVAHPADYRWSSHRAHAHGAADALVSDHPLYHALGRGAAERQTAYQGLFQTALEPGFVDALRAATKGGWALGDASSPTRSAGALRRSQEADRAGNVAPNSSLIYSDPVYVCPGFSLAVAVRPSVRARGAPRPARWRGRRAASFDDLVGAGEDR
jgi:putative transposase